jgi:hypothetical protein
MKTSRARSSAAERTAHNRLVPGSIPGEPTINIVYNEGCQDEGFRNCRQPTQGR